MMMGGRRRADDPGMAVYTLLDIDYLEEEHPLPN